MVSPACPACAGRSETTQSKELAKNPKYLKIEPKI